MSWWTETGFFEADFNDDGWPSGFITFPSSVVIKTAGGDLCYDNGLNVSQWARENGKPFCKKSLVFKRIDLPMEVDILNYDDLVPKNEGRLYKCGGKLWEIKKYVNCNEYYFQDYIETPTEMLVVPNFPPSDYDVTNYARVRVLADE